LVLAGLLVLLTVVVQEPQVLTQYFLQLLQQAVALVAVLLVVKVVLVAQAEGLVIMPLVVQERQIKVGQAVLDKLAVSLLARAAAAEQTP
jgi:hypothetical protein